MKKIKSREELSNSLHWKKDPETVLQALKRLKRLYNTPARWMQYSFARDRNNSPISIYHENAVCFCISGACSRIFPIGQLMKPESDGVLMKTRDALVKQAEGHLSLMLYNDQKDRTFKDIKDLIQTAIDHEEAKV